MGEPKQAVLLVACTDRDVPQGDAWLGPRERHLQSGLVHRKRRLDWRRGRWTAKAAMARRLDGLAVERIEVLPNDAGAPEVYVDGAHVGVSLTISHRRDFAVCAVTDAGALGCDLEHIEPRSRGFVRDFFCPGEVAHVLESPTDQQPLLANLIWSAKESSLKALGVGLRRDTRSVEVLDIQDGDEGRWCALSVLDHATGITLYGWWRYHGEFLMTLVSDRAIAPP